MNSEEKKIILTKSQKEAVNAVKDFVLSDNDIFILSGAAGTGKTTVLKNIIEEVNELTTGITLLAPTNRAAKVLSGKTGTMAGTIHSEIYTIKEIKNGDGNIIQTKLVPRYLNIVLDEDEMEEVKEQNILFVVDEASMLSANPNKEGALISDRSILKDFFIHIKHYTPNNKILFVGDRYQLPPIHYESVAPALDPEFLCENFTTKTIGYELTEVLRQETDSPVLKIAQEIKVKIDQGFRVYNLVTPIRYAGYDSFIKEFIKYYDTENIENTIALGWSRKNVLKMNLDIRKQLYSKVPAIFEPGDMLYVNARWRSESFEIQKGEIGKVVEVINEDGIKGNMLFHTLAIEFTNIENNPYTIQTKVLSDYTYVETEYIPGQMFIKLAIERSRENKTFKKSRNNTDDEFMNAMQVKFAYALTVHKAQGGEWENVFLHANTNWKDLRWNYTAVTRASKNLHSYIK